MQRRFPTRMHWFSGQMDFAPLACVFFLLVIFLTLQSHLAPVPGVPVELPAADVSEPAGGADWLVLAVDKEGRLYFRQQLTTDAALVTNLAAKAALAISPVQLVIQADRALALGRLAEIYSLCRRAGITNLKLQTRPLSGAPELPRKQP